MSYSVIRFDGSIQDVLDEGLSLVDADILALQDIWKPEHEAGHVTAVVDEEHDTVVWNHIYQNGRRLNRSTVNSIVYGLGRFV